VCGDGEQTRQVWCRMTRTIPGVQADILPDAWCDGSSRPADRQNCNAGSCTGAEWMSSEWSGVSRVCLSDCLSLGLSLCLSASLHLCILQIALSRVVGGRCHTAATPLVDHDEQRPQSSQRSHDGGMRRTRRSSGCLRSELVDGRVAA